MKVLFFSDEDEELRGRMLFSLEGQAGARVTASRTLAEALQWLKQPGGDSGWELLVYAMKDGKLPEGHRPFWEAAKGIPVVVSAPDALKDAARQLSRSLIAVLAPDKLVHEVAEVVQRLVDEGQFKRERPDHGYCRIATGLLIALSPLKADVFIRLGPEKFLKLMRAGDEFSSRDLEKYRDHKGIEFLWLEAKDLVHFLKRFEAELEKQLLKAHEDPAGSARMVAFSQAAVREIVSHMGVTPEVQQVAKLQVQTAIRSMQSNWKLSRLITQLKEEGGFIAYHSMLLAYMSCLISQRTKWSGEYTSYKLTFAAFLHDMALGNQELATLDSLADLERRKKEFSSEDVQDFRLHPSRAAELCRQFRDAPFDVEMIVLQHHERPDGSGFPRGLKYDKINPLSAILIVAHELIYFMRNTGKAFRMEDFIACMEHYYVGDFEQILEAIRFEG